MDEQSVKKRKYWIAKPHSFVDALGVAIILASLPRAHVLWLQVAFIAGTAQQVLTSQHTWIAAALVLFLAISKVLNYDFSVLYWVSLCVMACCLAGGPHALKNLMLCCAFLYLSRYVWNAYGIFSTVDGIPVIDIWSLLSLPKPSTVANMPVISNFALPFSVTYGGLFLLVQGFGDEQAKKSHTSTTKRQPIWWAAAMAKLLTMDTAEKFHQQPCALEYTVRYVEDHLVGLKVHNPESLAIQIDGVEWAQVWADDSKDLVIIYGLTPGVNYLVKILDPSTGIASKITISTNTAAVGEVRRKTPMTTLLDAQAIAETALAEERMKMRKMRKDHNKLLAQLKNEISSLNSKQARSLKNDERLNRKLASLQDSIKQMQQDIKEVEEGTEELERHKPKSDTAYHLSEQEYQASKSQLDAEEAKLSAESEKQSEKFRQLDQEVTKLEAKKQKQKQKLMKLTADAERVVESTNATVQKVLDKRREMREQRLKRRLNLQSEFEATIRKLELGVQDIQTRTRLFEEARNKW